jgi:hypothetical protein
MRLGSGDDFFSGFFIGVHTRKKNVHRTFILD